MEQTIARKTRSPQELFLAWLVDLPDGISVAREAMNEIARIDAVPAPSKELLALRALFHQATAIPSGPPSRRLGRRRCHG
jgi:hypothetical protein